MRICIITNAAGVTPLNNLLQIMSFLLDEIFLICTVAPIQVYRIPRNVTPFRIHQVHGSTIIHRILNHILTQIQVMFHSIRISRKVDTYLYFIGGEMQLFSIISLKMVGKRVVMMLGGIASRVAVAVNDPLSNLIRNILCISLNQSNHIILYTPSLSNDSIFKGLHHKILYASGHYLDFELFKIYPRNSERTYTLGFIGRMSNEKGVINLLRAIPLIQTECSSLSVVLCGSGQLSDFIRAEMQRLEIDEIVKLVDWIPRTDIPNLLNEIQILIIPSFTEGLPNVMLEAMACGSIVLATSVGSIPDIVQDYETGLILKSSHPTHIARSVSAILKQLELMNNMQSSARKMVEHRFTFEHAIRLWGKTLTKIGVVNKSITMSRTCT